MIKPFELKVLKEVVDHVSKRGRMPPFCSGLREIGEMIAG
jgi:hypothetical protein